MYHFKYVNSKYWNFIDNIVWLYCIFKIMNAAIFQVFNQYSHCPTAMSTQPVRYSGYYDWFILLWPRHDHFSSWIKIKGVPFWKSNQFVVTQPNLQIIYDGQIFIFWQRSKVLSIKLWPKLKFWHWSLCCWVPVSISVAKFLVTCQIYW